MSQCATYYRKVLNLIKEMSENLNKFFFFQDLLRALAPDYEVPDATHLAALVDEDQLGLN